MLMRLVARLRLFAIVFPLAVAAYGKCPAGQVEIHGSIVGKLPLNAKLTVSFVFRNGRKHPAAEMIRLEGSSFAKTLGFSLRSSSGLLGEWGEKCDRTLEHVVVRLVDGEGREVDRLSLNVQGDFLVAANGLILRSPAILHGD